MPSWLNVILDSLEILKKLLVQLVFNKEDSHWWVKKCWASHLLTTCFKCGNEHWRKFLSFFQVKFGSLFKLLVFRGTLNLWSRSKSDCNTILSSWWRVIHLTQDSLVQKFIIPLSLSRKSIFVGLRAEQKCSSQFDEPAFGTSSYHQHRKKLQLLYPNTHPKTSGPTLWDWTVNTKPCALKVSTFLVRHLLQGSSTEVQKWKWSKRSL